MSSKKAIQHQPEVSPSIQVLTVEEVSTLLKISTSSVYELTRFRHSRRSTPLPHRKVGRYLRFLRHEVESWFFHQPQAVNSRKRAYRRVSS